MGKGLFGRSISLGCELQGFDVSSVYAGESGQQVMVAANGWTPSDNCSLADWLVKFLSDLSSARARMSHPSCAILSSKLIRDERKFAFCSFFTCLIQRFHVA